MRTRLIGAAAAAALLCSAGAMAQTVPPGSTEPVPPVPGTTVPGAVDQNRTQDPSVMDTRPQGAPEVVAPTAPRLDRTSAETLLGRTAIGADGKKLGEVEDVILNASSGDAERLIITSGGFLGMGKKAIAVDIADAEFLGGDKEVQVRNLTSAQVEQMAEYKYDQDTLSLTRTDRR